MLPKEVVDESAIARKRKFVAGFAVVIIIACVALIAWQFRPVKPIEIPKRPADLFLASISDAMNGNELKWPLLHFEATEDGNGVLFKGRVATAADLETLKKIAESGQPKVDLKFEVTVGR